MISRRAASLWFFTVATGLALGGLFSSAGAAALSVRVTVPPGPVEIAPTARGDRIAAPGTGWEVLRDFGRPEIPYRVVRVLLPQGEEMEDFTVEASPARLLRMGVSPTVAGPRLSDDGGSVADSSFFAGVAGTAFPPVRARFLASGLLHSYTIATFAVFPFESRDGALYAFDEINLSVRTRPSAVAPVARLRHRDGFRESIRARVAAEVANPGMLDGYSFHETIVPEPVGGFDATAYPSLEGSAVDYIIITPDALAATFQTLADWKTMKGVPTVVRTTEWIAAHYRNGSDLAETIRNFVTDAYAKWGLRYVMLGGDVQMVPARMAWSEYFEGGRELPVDMYFGCLDGDWNADHDAIFGEYPVDNADLYAEVYVGRLPARTAAEASVMINKVMDYERPKFSTYGNKTLMLAEVLFPPTWQPGDVISLNGADITEYVRNSSFTDPSLNVTRMYQTNNLFPGSLPETRQTALDSLNAGYNHVVHVGHGYRFNMSVGDVSIVNADADALINGGRLSNLNFLNCTAAAYTYESLAEHFLRNPNGGAVSVVGSNDSAFPTVASEYMHEYYRLVFNQNVVHIGEAFTRSREARTGFALSGDNIDRWTHFVYTLLADPEMPLVTRSVQPLTVVYPASVSKGLNSILVTVTSGGNPVDSAVVCLSKGDEDYDVGRTNTAGQVTLKSRAESTGNIDVVVTGRNYARYQGAISVGGTGAYLNIGSMTIDDDNVGGTSGNGNGVIEAGETVDFGITLKNTGTATASNLSIRLRCPAGGVTVVDSTASVTTSIPAGGTGLATGGVRVAFPATLTDGQAIRFLVIIRVSGVENWRDDFKKEVHRAKLDLVKLRVDDTGTGNGNGVVDAGEQFKLFYKVKNFGTGTYPGGNATVYDLDAGFTLIDATDTYGAILPQGQAENGSGGFVLVEPSVAVAHRLRVSIVDLYGRAYEDTVELRPPLPPGALAIDPSLGPDRLKVTWGASSSPDVARYNIYRSLNAGGPFTLANVDPVAHTLFVDVGLAPNTAYYFRASAIDASGNESGMTAVFAGSTNPRQLAGWPIPMKTETSSSPAVGDIDGDGTNEVVVGADRLYAWHANGIELVDGDNDAQTWGVLSSLGSSFVSPVALARIDLARGLDIIAASRDTKQVFVFNHQGTVLAGWPRSVENTLRAGLVAADLDGNGLFEIIAVDEKGVIYVWRSNGTELIDGDSNPATQGVFYRMPNCTFNYSTPAAADIDGDGKDELIVGSQGDRVYVFNEDGSMPAGWPFVASSDIAGSPAVGDVDANGDLEIVFNEANGSLWVLNHDASTLVYQFFSNNPWNNFFASSPALGNVTGDAKLEIVAARASGKIYLMNSAGAVLPGWPVNYATTTYTESSPIIADFNSDGAPDIVLGDETQFIDAFDVNGQLVPGFPLATKDAMRGVPTAADVDQDGDVDLVAAGWDKNVYVWDFAGAWSAGNAVWPRFHANLHNNGRVGFVVPTGVGGASFVFAYVARGLELVWDVMGGVEGEFTVKRAEVADGVAGVFETVASRVGIGVDGKVRVVDRGVEMGSRYVYRLEGEGGDVVYETAGLYVPVTRAALGQNYPNPFNPVTRIEYWVPGGAGGRTPVSLVIYDVRGARVRTVVSEAQASGRYVVEWDGRTEQGVPAGSGVYFYRLETPGFVDTRKMVLLK